jgi:membrane carboxypeptidase/penicillin-binding protein
MKVGISYVARTASLFGFGDNLPEVPSLALGAGEVTPLQMARAYAGIANGGMLLNLSEIRMIASPDTEEPLYKTKLLDERVASEPAVYVLTDILRSVIENGTGNIVRRLGFDAPAAGKTGTSNDERDAWFAGFTPRILAVVWVGFDDNSELKLTGGTAAAPIWTNFMKCAAEMEPRLDFVTPPGVIFRVVDLETGLLDTGSCPKSNVVREVFVKGTEPVTPCPLHSRTRQYGEQDYDSESRTIKPRPPRKEQKSLWDKIFGL